MLIFLFSALIILVVSTITILSMSRTAVNMSQAKENMDTTEAFLVGNYVSRLQATAAAAQALFNADDLDRLRSRPNAPPTAEAWRADRDFAALRDRLISFADDYDLEYVYFYFRIDNHVQPVIDNDPDVDDAYTPESALLQLDDSMREAWNEKRIVLATEDEQLVDLDGLMTAYAPIINYYGEVTALVGVDIKDRQIHILRGQIEDLSSRIEALSGNMNILVVSMIIALALLLTGGILTIRANRKRAEVLSEALIEAEEANKAKSAFLSTMSHEIRTPMNAILGITEIQLQNESLDEHAKEALGKIYNSGDLLLSIINDILDLSKIEAGKLELIDAKYEIASLVSDTAQLNIMRIGTKPIEFELYVDENIPTLLNGDELRIKQILNNLLSNAFKYSSEGLVKLTVNSEAGRNDDEVKLILGVSDTGQGMTPEQVSALFDEYSRFNMEANRTTEGTGLGMSITRNLIRMMDGEIFIESEPGKGSIFTVHIPQGRISEETLGKAMAENLHQFRTSGRVKMDREEIKREPMPYGSVLVVDDVETNIYVARGLMTPYALQIDSADSGFEALRKIEAGNVYDIVFMDHMMPKMDGIETTQKIRDTGYGHTIVALTANAVAGQADIFLSSGFDDFISKPINIHQLNAILNKYIMEKQPPEVVEAARKEAAENAAASAASSGADSGAGGTGATGGEPGATAPAGGAGATGIDPLFAEVFARDARKALALLLEIDAKAAYGDEAELRSYVINVHGMKSALANVGNKELSAVAQKLEASGRAGETDALIAKTPGFLETLREFIDQIAPQPEAPESGEAGEEDTQRLKEMLLAIKEACGEYDESAADEALSELRKTTWSKETGDLLSAISEYLLHSDFDEAAEAVDAFLSD